MMASGVASPDFMLGQPTISKADVDEAPASRRCVRGRLHERHRTGGGQDGRQQP